MLDRAIGLLDEDTCVATPAEIARQRKAGRTGADDQGRCVGGRKDFSEAVSHICNQHYLILPGRRNQNGHHARDDR